jgi:poly(A) polymerase
MTAAAVREELPPLVWDAAIGVWRPRRSRPRAAPRSELTLVTWNAWFDQQIEPTGRARALIRALHDEAPALVSLHEVTARLLAQLLAEPFVRATYAVSHAEPDEVPGYTSIVLAPIDVRAMWHLPLPSAMGRALVGADLDTAAGELRFGGAHLESMAEHEPERAAQYALATAELAHSEAAIFCGDFNFCSTSPENLRVKHPWMDLWPLLRPGEEGWTRDSSRNPMLQRASGERRQRLDRVLLRDVAGRWNPTEIRLLGTEPYDDWSPELRPSDHFGLFARLSARSAMGLAHAT